MDRVAPQPMHVQPQCAPPGVEYVSVQPSLDHSVFAESERLKERHEPMSLNLAAAEEAKDVPIPKFLCKQMFNKTEGHGIEGHGIEGYGTEGFGTNTNSEGCLAQSLPTPVPEASAGLREDPFRLMPQKADSDSRWWTKSRTPLACPLTQLPISLLPYPPFKLCVNSRKPSPRKLVDGKYLALQIIVNGQYVACGRLLEQPDIKDIDDYIHRCKLGPFRPGKAVALSKMVESAKEPEKKKFIQELKRFRAAARAELGKLRRIQESRLVHLGLTPGGDDSMNVANDAVVYSF